MAMLCRLDGRPASAVKPAPRRYRDCRPGRAGSVPASRPTSRRLRLVNAGKLHAEGAVTDPIPRSVRLCSAGSDEMASSAPLKHDAMRVQSMRSDVSDVQLAMPAGRPPTAEVLPNSHGSYWKLCKCDRLDTDDGQAPTPTPVSCSPTMSTPLHLSPGHEQ